MPDPLQIGTSGLLAFQRGLSTTGHNIANASTEGYSRQSVSLTTDEPRLVDGRYLGTGVSVAGIERSYSDYLAKDFRLGSSSLGQFEAAANMATRLDNLMADQERGLSAQLERFFNALQDVGNNPTSVPERQVLIGVSNALAEQFHYLDGAFEALNSQVNDQLTLYVDEINQHAQSISELNDAISYAQALSTDGAQPNDLLDERDRVLLQLSKLVSVNVIEQDGGVANVLIGNGQPLVIGGVAEKITMGIGEFDPLIQRLTYERANGTSTDITNYLTGGAVQGLIDFRDNMLNSSRQQLGLLATGMSEVINAQHGLGVDLQGKLGGEFFVPFDAETIKNIDNTGSASSTTKIVDISLVQPTDYKATFTGGAWEVKNIKSGEITVGNGLMAIDGLEIEFSGDAEFGDSFLIRPNFRAANYFEVALQAPADIAAASPLKFSESLSNTGTAEVDSLVVNSRSDLPLDNSFTLTFDASGGVDGVPGYVVTGGPGGFLPFDPETEFAGKTFQLDSGFGDAEIRLSGKPENGDVMTIERNTEGTGDNRNLLALIDIQTKDTLLGSSTSLQDVFALSIADVGIRTRQSQLSLETQEVLTGQAENAYKAKSAVNLDEEAANLLRYQQAYSAAAKVITVADEMFNILLSTFR